MRAIPPPEHASSDVYRVCVDSISDTALKNRLIAQAPSIEVAANDYNQKAQIKQLHLIAPNDCDSSDVVLGDVTKKELKALYSSQMLNNKEPRAIYDSILSQAPLGKCPFCGFGHASTLDHYLPKAKFPQLAVITLNLVPSCKDCNHGKNAAVATTAAEQGLHPYYDHDHFINDQWLVAEIESSVPETVVSAKITHVLLN